MLTVVLVFIIGLAGAILIARWGWREAKQYARWREAIRRITSHPNSPPWQKEGWTREQEKARSDL